MRAGQKRTKWKRSWSAIVTNDNSGRRLSRFWLYWFPSQFLAGPRHPVIAPFHSLLYQSCGKLGSLCCQLQRRGWDNSFCRGRRPSYLKLSVLFLLRLSSSSCDVESTSFLHLLYPFYGIAGPAPGLLSCSGKITPH